MNYTESFEQFSSRVTPTDLALYAGVGLIIWVLAKDQLGVVQTFLKDLVQKFNNSKPKDKDNLVVIPVVGDVVEQPQGSKEDLFFKLITSWKQTRDLAASCKCDEAVKAADQMFPYLSPVVCSKKETNTEVVK